MLREFEMSNIIHTLIVNHCVQFDDRLIFIVNGMTLNILPDKFLISIQFMSD